MIKRAFFNLGAPPKLTYSVLAGAEAGEVREIPLPEKAVLHFPGEGPHGLKTGDRVRTGQKFGSGADTLISTVTGSVADISPRKDSHAGSYTAITLDVSSEEEWDEGFLKVSKESDIRGLLPYLDSLPGRPSISSVLKAEDPGSPEDSARSKKGVGLLMVNALDKDLMLTTNQFLLLTRMNEMREGIEHLRRLLNPGRIMLVVPRELASSAEKVGVEVKAVKPVYPHAHPELLIREILRKGKGLDEAGIAVMNVEAVIGLNSLLGKGEFPVKKTFTVIGKDLKTTHVQARIGTPMKNVLDALGIRTEHGDRIVLGGPMCGESVYWEETPITADTDGILVQGKGQIQPWSDTHCINCGECVRACPSRVQVNMLIRFLENGLYQEAEDLYDLMNCIECGVCGSVCPARIPLFQYIMLGKHECQRKKTAEVANG